MLPRQRPLHMIAIVLLGVISIAACGAKGSVPAPYNRSVVEANVPAKADFKEFLKRDLAAYFSTTHSQPVTITYALLRSTPTQSGLLLPSFHAWVKIVAPGKVIDEGAVTVEAIGKDHFAVVYYVSHTDIFEDPKALDEHFPPAVADLIRRTYAPCVPPLFC